MKTCTECKYLRKDIKIPSVEMPSRFGKFACPCNRYPQNTMRSPKEPACGEFKPCTRK